MHKQYNLCKLLKKEKQSTTNAFLDYPVNSDDLNLGGLEHFWWLKWVWLDDDLWFIFNFSIKIKQGEYQRSHCHMALLHECVWWDK